MKNKFSAQLLVVSVWLFALSCSDDFNQDSIPPDEPLLEFVAPEGIVFNGDYLIIPTPQLYEQTKAALRSSDPASVSKWATKVGLLSMRDIYDRALREQDEYMMSLQKEYTSLSPDEVRAKGQPMIPQTPFVAEHAGLFEFDETGAILRLKLANPLMDRLLNGNGLIMVAGHIFQYNETNTKIIVGGDDRKIALLPSVNDTNEKLNIIVTPVTVERREWAVPGNARLNYNSGINRCDISPPLNTNYYFNYSVSLSTHLEPIYDYSNLICDPPGCGQARTAGQQDCYCYYPIISQQGFTLHYATMECRKSTYGLFNTQHHSERNRITATTTDNIYGTRNYSYTNTNMVNATLYLYDGPIPAGYDVTSGSYTFYERTWSQEWADINFGNGTLEGQVTHSW